MRSDYDIAIVGGGMVGAAMACALRGSGLRTAWIDAQAPLTGTQPSYDDRTVALADSSRRIFETLGIWPDLASQAVAIPRIHISDRGRFGITRLDAADAGLPALGYVVANRAVAAALNDAVRGAGEIVAHRPATLRAIVPTTTDVALDVEAASERLALRARLVIAADGADSPIRTLLGIEARRVDYGQAAIVTAVTPEYRGDGTAYERFTPTGPIALLPASGGRYVVIWSMPADRAESLAARSDIEFLTLLQEQFGDRLGTLTRLGRRQLHPLTLTHVAQPVHGRVVLIGNAAHTVHPVAGQGFNLGLRDVAALAQVIVEAHRRHEDFGAGEALSRYAAWRAQDNRAITAFTHSLVRIFSNEYLPVSLARSIGLLAVDLCPPLKRRFIRLTSGLAGTVPRLARGLPL